ncbi:MAG TPA: hypothetical protein VMV83_01560 [Rectinemataceae bacterium]|nr:hypothetical protein [Rectinemataceae bacterium]
MVNRYSIYESDIEPLGSKTALIEIYVTDDTVDHLQRLLDEKELRDSATTQDFELGRRYLSHGLLEQRIREDIRNFGIMG